MKYPERQNVSAPVGISNKELSQIISLKVGKWWGDKYIRWNNLPDRFVNPWGNLSNEPELYLRRSVLSRKLYGSSEKTEKNDGTPVEVRVIYMQPANKSDLKPPKSRVPYPKDMVKLAKCDGIYPIKVKQPKKKKKVNPPACRFFGACGKLCLVQSGQLGKEDAGYSAYMKSWFWYSYPLVFLRQLIWETYKEADRSTKYDLEFYARLNGTTDIPWERYLWMDKMVKDFAGLGGFYDYTKYPLAVRLEEADLKGKLPAYYDITFSLSEMETKKYSSWKHAFEWLAEGGKVAAVVEQYTREKGTGKAGKNKWFLGKGKPKYWFHTDFSDLQAEVQQGLHPYIIDGDKTDYRFADPARSIIILRPKGITVDDHRGTKTGKVGAVYMPKSTYSKKPVILTKKQQGFIKTKKQVEDLQDAIIQQFGYPAGYKPRSVAKNPSGRQTKINARYDPNREVWFLVLNGGIVDIEGVYTWRSDDNLDRDLQKAGLFLDEDYTVWAL